MEVITYVNFEQHIKSPENTYNKKFKKLWSNCNKDCIHLEPANIWTKTVPWACEIFGSAPWLYYLIIAGSLFIRYHNSSGLLFEHSRSCPKTGFCSFSNNSIRPIYQPGPQNWCHKDALTPLSRFSFSVQNFLEISFFGFYQNFLKLSWIKIFDVNEPKHTCEIALRTC